MLIYLLDDDPLVHSLVINKLQDYEVRAFKYSTDCLHAFEQEVPDLLILDYFLEETTGLIFLGELYEMYPDQVVVVLSDNTQTQNIMQLKSEGLRHYIFKGANAVDEIKLLIEDELLGSV